jgi:hypothetical protein
MPGRKPTSRVLREPTLQEEHPCVEWFRWFVGNCLHVNGGESTREVLTTMRAILDAALESLPHKQSGARTPRRRAVGY